MTKTTIEVNELSVTEDLIVEAGGAILEVGGTIVGVKNPSGEVTLFVYNAHKSDRKPRAKPYTRPRTKRVDDLLERMVAVIAAARRPIGTAEIARKAGINMPLAYYHLRQLAMRGTILSEVDYKNRKQRLTYRARTEQNNAPISHLNGGNAEDHTEDSEEFDNHEVM